MQLKELIRELEKLYKEEGDVVVTFGDSEPIEYVEILKSFITGEKVVVIM